MPEGRQGRRWGGLRGRSVSPEPRRQPVAAPQEPRTDPRSQAILELRRRAEEVTQNAARPAARDEQADLQEALQVAYTAIFLCSDAPCMTKHQQQLDTWPR